MNKQEKEKMFKEKLDENWTLSEIQQDCCEMEWFDEEELLQFYEENYESRKDLPENVKKSVVFLLKQGYTPWGLTLDIYCGTVDWDEEYPAHEYYAQHKQKGLNQIYLNAWYMKG